MQMVRAPTQISDRYTDTYTTTFHNGGNTMKKIEALRKEYKARLEEQSRIAASLDTLRTEAATAKSRMQEAAARGSVEEYMKAKAESDLADAALYVNETRMKAPVLMDRKEVEAAWKDHEAAYAQKMKAIMLKLEQAKKELVTVFDSAVTEQDTALSLRKECADLCGADQNDFTLSNVVTVGNNDIVYRGFIEYILSAKGLDINSVEAAGPRGEYWRVLKSRTARA